MKNYTLLQEEAKLIFDAMQFLEYNLEDYAVPPRGWSENRYTQACLSVFNKYEKLAKVVTPVEHTDDECYIIRQALTLYVEQPDAAGYIGANSDAEAQAALVLRSKFE